METRSHKNKINKINKVPISNRRIKKKSNKINYNKCYSQQELEIIIWLKKNYKTASRDYIIGKREIFEHYKEYCNSHKMKYKRNSDFGKLVKKTFSDIGSCRIGPAGKQISHYNLFYLIFF